MTSKGQMAMAVGAGYMLGRTHKMKLALMLAGFGASRRFPGGSLGLLNEGRKLLADSPEVAKLGGAVRKELMNAAKAAAVTAASQRIDSLNNRLQSGEDLLGGPGEAAGGKKKSKPARDEEPDDEYEDETGDDETGDDDGGDELSRARRTRAKATTDSAPVRRAGK